MAAPHVVSAYNYVHIVAVILLLTQLYLGWRDG